LDFEAFGVFTTSRSLALFARILLFLSSLAIVNDRNSIYPEHTSHSNTNCVAEEKGVFSIIRIKEKSFILGLRIEIVSTDY
jgi:hypothetical protein